MHFPIAALCISQDPMKKKTKLDLLTHQIYLGTPHFDSILTNGLSYILSAAKNIIQETIPKYDRCSKHAFYPSAFHHVALPTTASDKPEEVSANINYNI